MPDFKDGEDLIIKVGDSVELRIILYGIETTTANTTSADNAGV